MLQKDFTREYIIQHADTINWEYVCSVACLDVIYEISDDFHEEFYWLNISKRALSENFIRKFEHKLDLYAISQGYFQHFSDQFFIEFEKKILWYNICSYNLKEDFIEKYKDKIYWPSIVRNSKLSDDFLRRNQDRLDWSLVSRYQSLSSSLKEEFKNKLTIEFIEIKEAAIDPKEYTREYIEKYAEHLSWVTISNLTSLTVIDEISDGKYSENIQWTAVSHRVLTESFVKKHSEKINWNAVSRILKKSNFSKEFYEDFEDKINWEVFLTL